MPLFVYNLFDFFSTHDLKEWRLTILPKRSVQASFHTCAYQISHNNPTLNKFEKDYSVRMPYLSSFIKTKYFDRNNY